MEVNHNFAEAWSPIDTRPIYEWAGDGNIVLPAAYAMPGEFDVRKSRYLIAPFDAIQSHTVRSVTVVKPVQSGGTLLADITVPWFIRNRPGPIMWNMQTDEVAEDHARDRALPVIRECRELKPLLPRDPRKMNMHGAEFPHMSLYIQGSTPAQLQSKSILFLINDEVWRWAAGRLTWALARVSAFERVGMSKVLNISQAGKVDDDLDRAFKRGSCNEWTVPCQSCGKFFQPLWSGERPDGTKWGMTWDTNDRTKPGGKWHIGEVMQTIRFTCQHCGHAHADGPRLKAAWNLAGQYERTNPHSPSALESFHWNSVIVEPWAQLVEMWLEATDAYERGMVGPLINMIQQRFAQPDDPERIHAGETSKSEVYDVKSDWSDEVQRMMHVDVQEDHFWAEGTQYDKEGNSRQLFFLKVSTEAELRVLQQTNRINDNCVFLDVGYQRTKAKQDGGKTREIYALICKFNWCGLRGSPVAHFPHPHPKDPKQHVFRLYSQKKYGDPQSGTALQGRRFAKYFEFANDPISDIVGRIRNGRGVKWIVPPGSTEHARQLYAERKERSLNKSTGRDEWTWVKKRRDNHAFDLWKMKAVTALMSPLIKFDTTQTEETEKTE